MNEYESATLKLVQKLNEKIPDICRKMEEILRPYSYTPPYEYDKDKILYYVGRHLEYIGSGRKALLLSSIYSLEKKESKEAEEILVVSVKAATLNTDYVIRPWIRIRGDHLIKTGLLYPLLGNGFWAYPTFLLWSVYYSFLRDTQYTHLIEAFRAGLAMIALPINRVYAIPFPKCHINQNRNMHNESGPAIIWPTGEKSYYLNGVKVAQMIVETPAEQLDPHILLEERNAEVRREIVKKIGVERICHELKAKVIDKQGDYELLVLHLGDSRKRPYLKMRNPSMGCYHIEGVRSNIKTVKEALSWRNQTVEQPTILT